VLARALAGGRAQHLAISLSPLASLGQPKWKRVWALMAWNRLDFNYAVSPLIAAG
jgi:hypothetical protein